MTSSNKILTAAFVLLSGVPARADRINDNLQILLDAARKLEFSLPEDRAFLLIKQETIVTPVAVIFGYGDNGRACEELASTLSASGLVGTFKCGPIY